METMEKKLQKLRRFNLIMGAFHLAQAVIMLILATGVIQKIASFRPTITQNYLTYNYATQSLEPAGRELFELPFGIMVSVFLFLSAAAHAVVYFSGKRYTDSIRKGVNPYRWVEYALSSSIMIVLIATLFGIYDIASLLLIFAVNASMNFFGLVMEQLNAGAEKTKVNWGPFAWGSLAGIAPWIAILLYMFGTGNFDLVPWFVWAIVGTYFVAFNAFPVNMVLQYKRVGKWKDYIYGERVYIVLSLAAKSALAWLVLFGAMQP